MDDFSNPSRRYKDFRPRQASRAFKASGVPVNLATLSLFNNTTAPQYLVVRDIEIAGTVGDSAALSYQRLQIGTAQGKVQPLVPSMPAPPGLLASIDTATVYAGDFTAYLGPQGNYIWWHDYPVAVIEPNWSLVLQCSAATHALNVSLVWEAIAPEELDFTFE